MPKGPQPIDISGQKFNRLTAVSYTSDARWVFRCDCGQLHETKRHLVQQGKIKSCGCYASEAAKERFTTHGFSKHPLYGTWKEMIRRCTDPKSAAYKHYGARGIKVCDRWVNSFADFLADMGARPEGTTLDRERVNDNYQPDNCSWATGIEQGRNRRDNRYLDHNGKRQTIAEWARELGVGRMRIQSRLNMGWSIQQALELPKGARP